MQKLFHICSVINDQAQYDAQHRTFLEAGFTDEKCRFSFYDNSIFSQYEPYSTINKVLNSTQETFLIFCHQDIRLPVTASYNRLTAILTELEGRDANWAICGNAGVTVSQEMVQCLTDPGGIHLASDLPRLVQSLDENFLVLKTRSGIRCSPGLSGFHFYGTDLCLNAIATGATAYVIDFHLAHLSFGKTDLDFRLARKALGRAWNPRFLFRYVRTTCTTIFVSRWWLLRIVFSRGKVITWIHAHPRVRRAVTAIQTEPTPAKPDRMGVCKS